MAEMTPDDDPDIISDVELIKRTPALIEAAADDRDAAVLRLLAKLTIAETAELSGLSETTVKVIKRTWRQALPRKIRLTEEDGHV